MKTARRSNAHQNRNNELSEQIADLMARCRLTDWKSFTETVSVPTDIAVALITGRTEMLKLVRTGDMTAAEVAPLYDLIRVLLETNQALRDHAESTAKLTCSMMAQFKGVVGVAEQIDSFANFKTAHNADDED